MINTQLNSQEHEIIISLLVMFPYVFLLCCTTYNPNKSFLLEDKKSFPAKTSGQRNLKIELLSNMMIYIIQIVTHPKRFDCTLWNSV
jgi:hypothetical protein